MLMNALNVFTQDPTASSTARRAMLGSSARRRLFGRPGAATGSRNDAAREESVNKPTDCSTGFALWFEPLREATLGMAFPCTPDGEVIFAALTERARNNYLFARTCIGRLFRRPAVMPSLA